MLLMIDNYDSFTYNVVQYLRELHSDVVVLRNDQCEIDEVTDMAPEKIVISPGPCTPNEAGVSMSLIEHFGGRIPILGICLGMQAIAQVFGGSIIRAREPVHGKTSAVHHNNGGVFEGLSNPFEATRYHSLVLDPNTLPDCLEVTAWIEDSDGKRGEIMGLRHRSQAIEGVQFHPESILTQHGHDLLENFLAFE